LSHNLITYIIIKIHAQMKGKRGGKIFHVNVQSWREGGSGSFPCIQFTFHFVVYKNRKREEMEYFFTAPPKEKGRGASFSPLIIRWLTGGRFSEPRFLPFGGRKGGGGGGLPGKKA